MLTRLLTFVRALDDKGNLSITNLSVVAMLVKVFSSGAVSQTDLIALVAVILNYAIKKIMVYFEDRTPKPASVDMQALQDNVAKLTGELEDAKNKISSLSIAAGVRGFQKK